MLWNEDCKNTNRNTSREHAGTGTRRREYFVKCLHTTPRDIDGEDVLGVGIVNPMQKRLARGSNHRSFVVLCV